MTRVISFVLVVLSLTVLTTCKVNEDGESRKIDSDATEFSLSNIKLSCGDNNETLSPGFSNDNYSYSITTTQSSVDVVVSNSNASMPYLCIVPSPLSISLNTTQLEAPLKINDEMIPF